MTLSPHTYQASILYPHYNIAYHLLTDLFKFLVSVFASFGSILYG